MGIKRDKMVKYLLKETRYTLEELNKLPYETILKWYLEEKEVNKQV